MSTYTEDVGTKLNTLLEKTIDDEKGFLKAAGNAKHPDLKAFFTKKSKERYDFGYELKEELRKFGQSIEKGGSTAATVQRAWMDIKSTISLDNDEAMLEEALKIEKAALNSYEEVLVDKDLPPHYLINSYQTKKHYTFQFRNSQGFGRCRLNPTGVHGY
ncbi:ferritin-like domain-containing protein [Sediminicola sp. YIK13]|uniref:ferritin-like domain-containing protein n=1 Tax=Sediminicola sp. YIK13 TaxID=1453352 RepID=UPI0026D1EFD3